MSLLAKDLFEYQRLMRQDAFGHLGGALSQRMLKEVAAALIAAGLRPDLGGC